RQLHDVHERGRCRRVVAIHSTKRVHKKVSGHHVQAARSATLGPAGPVSQRPFRRAVAYHGKSEGVAAADFNYVIPSEVIVGEAEDNAAEGPAVPGTGKK